MLVVSSPALPALLWSDRPGVHFFFLTDSLSLTPFCVRIMKGNVGFTFGKSFIQICAKKKKKSKTSHMSHNGKKSTKRILHLQLENILTRFIYVSQRQQFRIVKDGCSWHRMVCEVFCLSLKLICITNKVSVFWLSGACCHLSHLNRLCCSLFLGSASSPLSRSVMLLT